MTIFRIFEGRKPRTTAARAGNQRPFRSLRFSARGDRIVDGRPRGAAGGARRFKIGSESVNRWRECQPKTSRDGEEQNPSSTLKDRCICRTMAVSADIKRGNMDMDSTPYTDSGEKKRTHPHSTRFAVESISRGGGVRQGGKRLMKLHLFLSSI